MKVNIGRPTTMENILSQREERARRIQSLALDYSKPILSLSINIPGSVKLTANSKKVFDESCSVLHNKIGDSIIFSDTCVDIAGCYALFVVDFSGEELKKVAIYIEDNHPLGRLIDLDVIDSSMKHIGRTDMNKMPRKCLICHEDAKLCGRSRRHSVAELVAKFDEIVAEWEKTL